MLPFVVGAGAALVCSTVAAHSPEADPGFLRFAQEIIKQPSKAFFAPVGHYLGLDANRFNLHGPFGIVIDWAVYAREMAKVGSLVSLTNQDQLDFDTPFSVFSNGEDLKCAKEALRHGSDALVRIPEMGTKLTAALIKLADTKKEKDAENNIVSFARKTTHVLESTSQITTHFRTMLLPRLQELTL